MTQVTPSSPIIDYDREKKRRNQYYWLLKRSKAKADSTGMTFEDYMNEMYGIRPLVDSTGSGYGLQYIITDKPKHDTFFLLSIQV